MSEKEAMKVRIATRANDLIDVINLEKETNPILMQEGVIDSLRKLADIASGSILYFNNLSDEILSKIDEALSFCDNEDFEKAKKIVDENIELFNQVDLSLEDTLIKVA